MRSSIIPLLCILALQSWTIDAQLISLQDIYSEINADSLTKQVNKLSGEEPVYLAGHPHTIFSRNTFQPGNELTFKYIIHEILKYDVAVDSFLFGKQGKNILALQPGILHPEQIYIICAHYDGMPPQGLGPAADDNASGTAAVIEAVRILSKYKFEYSILYAFWDEEEQGLVGSAAFAANPPETVDQILGVINLDAIAYDGDGDNLARIHVRPVANSLAIVDSILNINDRYQIGLDIEINNPGRNYSDHASFWRNGYAAILLIEDFDNDPNPYFHTTEDKAQFLQIPYFHKLARLSILSIAQLAVPLESVTSAVLDGKNSLASIFPNPFDQSIQVSLSGLSSPCIISISNSQGQSLFAENYHNLSEIIIGTSNFPQGFYFLQVIAGSYRQDFKLVKTIAL